MDGMKPSTWVTIAAGVVVVTAGTFLITRESGEEPAADQPVAAPAPEEAPNVPSVAVLMPAELSPAAESGQVAFAGNCAVCHGENGGGTDQGPPLIHIIYEPSHHADIAFVLAARNGTRAHHWRFGDMPPQPQVSEQEITDIIQFVREVQRQNGIF